MAKHFGLFPLLLFGLVATATSQTSPVPGTEWKQLASPGQGGWSVEGLKKIRGYIEEIGSTSAMIVQHGVIVVAVGDIARRSNLYSTSSQRISGTRSLCGMCLWTVKGLAVEVG